MKYLASKQFQMMYLAHEEKWIYFMSTAFLAAYEYITFINIQCSHQY